MNNCVISGYMQKKSEYVKNSKGIMEFRFMLTSYSQLDGVSYSLPIKVRGKLADECYSKIKVGYYVEVVGEITRPKPQQVLVVAHSVSFRTVKGANTVHFRTTELLEIFDTSKVLERLNGGSNEKKK